MIFILNYDSMDTNVEKKLQQTEYFEKDPTLPFSIHKNWWLFLHTEQERCSSEIYTARNDYIYIYIYMMWSNM